MLKKAQNQQASINDRAVVNKAIINVAIAVIHHQQQYLLGFRNSSQHQGDRYEFVGGKIDAHETAAAALIREVAEETGIDIHANYLAKLGRLYHDYGDKQVCLHVYKIELTTEQYQQHQHCDFGLEGQALTWVNKIQLLAGDYPLPAANHTILSWLQLPTQIVITYPLTQFSECTDITDAWLTYHQQHIPKGASVYLRSKASELKEQGINTTKTTKATDAQLADQLMRLRPDIYSVLPYDYADQNSNAAQLLMKSHSLEKTQSEQSIENTKLSQDPEVSHQVVAFHLTHHQLMDWFKDCKGDYSYSKDKPKSSQYAFSSRPLIVSCHNAESIHAANQLATARLKSQQPPVIAIFLSPVLATQSHPDSEPLGWQEWSSLAQLADMPVIGLGGLSPIMFEQAEQYGASSIAGIRQFLQS